MIRLLSPFLLGYTAWRAYKDGGKRYLTERLGVYSAYNPETNKPQLWIHAASVGEVLTVLPLLRAIHEPLLITTMSPTGAAVLLQQSLSNVRHVYLPVDFPGACRRFFQYTEIKRGWIVETEVWPWLYAHARNENVALTIINGRLSNKTSKQSKGILAGTYRRALQGVRVLTRSQEDTKKFIALGADSVETVGNLKYAGSDLAGTDKQAQTLSARPYVLAASTHEDEEYQLAKAWHKVLADEHPRPLLVIVPRHPERGNSICKQLTSLGIRCSMRSLHEIIPSDTQVYIGDTLGEMQAWYTHAIACFVGGSLIERGGHNVLEPARLGCPIVVGRHTFNFDDIVKPMQEQKALQVADDAQDVVEFLRGVAAQPHAYVPMSEKARNQATLSVGILGKYLQLLSAN